MMSQEYKNILVPVDGSKQAELALKKAISTAKRNGAHVDILNVVDTRAMSYNFAGMSDGSIAYLLTDAQENEHFNNIDIHVRLGNPKTVISFDFPRDHKNDLIMIGASGLSKMQRAVVGSVTAFVNRNSRVDVMVVRTDVNNELPTAEAAAK